MPNIVTKDALTKSSKTNRVQNKDELKATLFFIVKIHQNKVLSYMHLGIMKVRSL